MKFNIITTQPTIYDSFLKTGLIARGIAKGIIKIDLTSLYDFGLGVHKSIDDTPYGGGAGMVIRIDVMDKALSKIKRLIAVKYSSSDPAMAGESRSSRRARTILLTPQGKKFNQKMAKRLAKEKGLILISGRFEGYDERIRDLVDEEISIGDYVLTSGDLPAMVLVDAISRQIPGFIEKSESIREESFENNRIEYPQYTQPREYKHEKVPEVLFSGNHAKIAEWRTKKAIQKSSKRTKIS